MYIPEPQPKKGKLSSLGGRAAAVLRKILQAGHQTQVNRKTNTVTRYQRPLRIKRLLRSVNLLLAAVILIVAVGWLAFAALAKSDIFQVASVIVTGNKVATEHHILEKAGLNHGVSLLDLDIRKVENAIGGLPWVEKVTISRNWPSGLEIAVQEHKPLALMNLDDDGTARLYYIDANGHVFAPAVGGNDLDFPVLTGQGLAGDLRGMRIEKDSLTGMGMHFLLVAAQGNQILPLQAVSEVQVSEEKGLIVYLVDYPFPIYLGRERIRERYSLLVRLLAQLYEKDKMKEIKEIRMDYAENKIMVASLGNP
ncbi:MAG: FtsQ-type POTRA domain-containing protein [Desulfobulbaceae bacterium]|nr:FtsQ-type POTRA domain-containing protein [Desulfobulbaceae bacterium]